MARLGQLIAQNKLRLMVAFKILFISNPNSTSSLPFLSQQLIITLLTPIAACYIDVDVEDEILDPNHEYSQWHLLPNLLLEEIFSYLDVKERYYASLVRPIETL